MYSNMQKSNIAVLFWIDGVRKKDDAFILSIGYAVEQLITIVKARGVSADNRGKFSVL